jgi:hypothetical protein
MQQNARHTHPLLLLLAIEPKTSIRALLFSPTLLDNRPIQPASVQIAREPRRIIPTPALEIKFSVMVVRGICFFAPRSLSLLEGFTRIFVDCRRRVEYRFAVRGGPVSIVEDRVGRVHGFKAVLQRDSAGPHFRLHATSHEVFFVHGLQHAFAEPHDCVDEDAAVDVDEVRVREPVGLAVFGGEEGSDTGEVVPDLVFVGPGSVAGVPHGEQGDEVGGLVDAPFEIVGFHSCWGSWAEGFLGRIGSCPGTGAPYWGWDERVGGCVQHVLVRLFDE